MFYVLVSVAFGFCFRLSSVSRKGLANGADTSNWTVTNCWRSWPLEIFRKLASRTSRPKKPWRTLNSRHGCSTKKAMAGKDVESVRLDFPKFESQLKCVAIQHAYQVTAGSLGTSGASPQWTCIGHCRRDWPQRPGQKHLIFPLWETPCCIWYILCYVLPVSKRIQKVHMMLSPCHSRSGLLQFPKLPWCTHGRLLCDMEDKLCNYSRSS